jgi:hypothetical protein
VVRRPLARVPTSHRNPLTRQDNSHSGEENDATESARPFRAMEERLRKLGATYYLLERWGNDRQMYRFYCRMAIAGNPHFTRYFEDTHTSPVEAMQGVLEQVEAWRGRR